MRTSKATQTMRTTLLAAIAGLVLALPASTLLARQAAAAPAAAAPAKAPSGIEPFFRIRAAGNAAVNADGSLFVRDWPDGVWQVYRAPKDRVPQEARASDTLVRLTNFKDGAAGYTLSPDGSRMLVLAATGGDENTRVYSVDPNAADASSVKPLLDTPKVQFAVQSWLPDSSGFLYTANDASPRDFHVYRYDIATGKSTKLLANKGSWGAPDITKDGSRVLVGEFRSVSDSQIYQLDVKSGELTDISVRRAGGSYSPGDTTAANEIVGYLPGETGVLLLSDAEGGMQRLFKRDLASAAVGEATQPIAELSKFEIDQAVISEERDLLGVVTNEDGFGVLHLYRLPSFEKVQLPEIEQGVVTLNQLRGGRLVFTLSNSRVPGLAFEWTVPKQGATSSAAPRQLIFADTQGLDLSKMTLPKLIKYKSFDGLEIPAFLFLPAGADKGKPVPFIAEYHGGPEAQFRPTFDRLTQYLVSQGFGIIKPNVRGSTGYGREFHMMDNYKKRWDSVKDGVAAAQWLIDQGYAKPGKISSMGGSYGGFMSVATLIEGGPKIFGAGINVVGIVNFKTFLQQTADYRRALREVEYGPLSDPDFLNSVSPINRINDIKVPMLIAHGLNDPRVPIGEAVQLAEELQRRALTDPNLEPEILIFHDEGHGFQKLENRLLYGERVSRFLRRTIGQ
jgi:dipeptidyl aminopeptidase/acylaminoacyl peptidase